MSSAAVVDVAYSTHASDESPRPWSLPGRITFRLSFLYLMLYMFLNGNTSLFTLLQNFPMLDGPIHDAVTYPLGELTRWWAVPTFHLTGIAAEWHRDGSGDTLLNYLLCVTFLGVAVLGTVVWSVLDRRRAHYAGLYRWLRFFLRLNVGIGMLQYGFYKVYPIQMQPPNLAVLNAPLGDASPMTLLWTLLGLSPWYERVCGLAEVLGGVLILIRPTALAGAALSAFVMTNVVLYNMFFDVPVKLYAIHILVMAMVVMLPDIRPLLDFFVLHRPTKLRGVWVPRARTDRGRWAIVVFEIAFFVLMMASEVKFDSERYATYLASVRPAPIVGLWRIEPSTPMPQLFGGARWNEISIDNLTRAMARSTDGQLWRVYLKFDADKHTLAMTSRGGSGAVVYTWATPDPDHMVLHLDAKGAGTAAATPAQTVTFARVPTPATYPLLTRGFHMVSEWGYER
jgi:hypothetical protein